MTRSLSDIIRPDQSLNDLTEDQQNEIAELFEQTFDDYEPAPEDFALSAIRVAAAHRAQAEREALAAVRAARGACISWQKIGAELQTSGEAARQRYKDLVA